MCLHQHIYIPLISLKIYKIDNIVQQFHDEQVVQWYTLELLTSRSSALWLSSPSPCSMSIYVYTYTAKYKLC